MNLSFPPETALIRLVGLRVLEDSRLEDPAIGRRGGMAWVGDNIIEIGEPIVEGGAVDRFVRRSGSHMSSIAVQVADIDATVEVLAEHDVRVASRVDDHIVFTHPADTTGVVIEWFGDEERLDPRFGAVRPPPVPDPVLDVDLMAFGGAVVADPPAAAMRLASFAAPRRGDAGRDRSRQYCQLHGLSPNDARHRVHQR